MGTNSNERDIQAFTMVRLEYTESYDELTDSIYHYMEAYLNGSNLEAIMFMDEIENIIGINNHEDLINFVLLGGER